MGGFVLNLSAQVPSAEKKNNAFVEDFYKSFSGKIGKEPIKMDLHFINGKQSGKYNTPDRSIPLEVVSSPDQQEAPWILAEKTEDSLKIHTWKFWIGKEKVKAVVLEGNDKDNTKIHLTEDYPPGVSPFVMHSYQRTIALLPDDLESPFYEIELVFPIPKNPLDTDGFLNQEIKRIMGLDKKLTFDKGVEELLKDLKQNYQQVIEEEYGEQSEVIVNDWQFSKIIKIDFNEKDYLILSENTQEYTGGAHDYQHKKYYAFDRQKQKPLHLENLTTIDTVELQNLLENQFRKDFDLRADEQLDEVLFENHLKSGENFRFDKQGIYFVYNPYEVGPYALQDFEIFISYCDLKGTLIPEFAERMNLSTEKAVN